MALLHSSVFLALLSLLLGTVAAFNFVQPHANQKQKHAHHHVAVGSSESLAQVNEHRIEQPVSTGSVSLVAWNDRGLAPDQNDAPILIPSDGLDFIDWDLCNVAFHSNLAGLGPDVGEQSIRYYNVAAAGAGSQAVDLVVTVNSSYSSSNVGTNGLFQNSCFGEINVKSKAAVDLLFSWYLTGTNTSVALSNFYFSVYDMDNSPAAVEVYTIYNSVNNVFLAPNHTLDVSGSLSSGLTVEYRATEVGGGANNPTDPLHLTEDEQKRVVTVDFVDKTQWKVTFGVEGGSKGRNFVFAGRSSLVDLATTTTTTSGKATTSTPSGPPAQAPNTTSTTTTTSCDVQSCQIFADPHVSGFDNSENQGPAYFALYAQRDGEVGLTSARSHTFDSRPVDVNAYDTGDFWLVKSQPVHIQGRFRYSGEFTPDMAAIGAVAVGGPFISGSKLIVEPLDGTVTFNGVHLPQQGVWRNVAGDVLVNQSAGDVEARFPMNIRVLFKRLDKHVDVQITMPRLPGGMDGECGNYDGIAENDDEGSVMKRLGDLRVEEGVLLFDTKFENSAFRQTVPTLLLWVVVAWMPLLGSHRCAGPARSATS